MGFPINCRGWKQKGVANTCSGFHRSSAKPQENLQQPDKHLRYTRFFLRGEIQGNI